MTALTIRLPKSLHKEIKLLAQAEGVSINQFLTLAAAEKISALRTLDYLREEAAKGSGYKNSLADFEAFLAALPDDHVEDDRLDLLHLFQFFEEGNGRFPHLPSPIPESAPLHTPLATTQLANGLPTPVPTP